MKPQISSINSGLLPTTTKKGFYVLKRFIHFDLSLDIWNSSSNEKIQESKYCHLFSGSERFRPRGQSRCKEESCASIASRTADSQGFSLQEQEEGGLWYRVGLQNLHQGDHQQVGG